MNEDLEKVLGSPEFRTDPLWLFARLVKLNALVERGIASWFNCGVNLMVDLLDYQLAD